MTLPRRGDECGTDIHGHYFHLGRPGKMRGVLAGAATYLQHAPRASARHHLSEPGRSSPRAQGRGADGGEDLVEASLVLQRGSAQSLVLSGRDAVAEWVGLRPPAEGGRHVRDAEGEEGRRTRQQEQGPPQRPRRISEAEANDDQLVRNHG